MSSLVVTGLESRVANCVAVAAWPAPPLYKHTLITWPHLLKMPASFALFFYQYLPRSLVLCLYFPKPNERSWIGMRINEGRSRRALCSKHIWNVLIYGSFLKSLICVMSVVGGVGFLQCCPPHLHLLQRVGFVFLGQQQQLAFIRSLCAQDGFTASKDVDK